MLYRVAQHGPHQYLGPWLARLSKTGESHKPFSKPTLLRLLKYARVGWEASVGIVGREASQAVDTLQSAGYRNAGVALLEGDRRYACLILLDGLEQLEQQEIPTLLEQAAQSSSSLIVSAASYPEALLTCPPRDWRTVRPRSWWLERMRESGLELDEPPRESFPPLHPLFARGERQAPQRTPAAPVGIPDVVFVMPEAATSFRWVVESLTYAAREERLHCRLVTPAQLDDKEVSASPKKVTWAHYWDPYSEVETGEGRRYEQFVLNFRMRPRGELTPWLAELRHRGNVKLVPSTFAGEILRDIGVPPDEIRLLPHGYSPEFLDVGPQAPLATRKSFRFLAVINSYDPSRFGLDLLLRGYRQAFSSSDDVCLVIRDYGGDASATAELISQSEGPEILYYAQFIAKPELGAFYSACQAFVSPYRGEGFGMKILDAAVLGLPLVAPAYGGPTDFCPVEKVHPVAFDEVAVGDCLETRELQWREELRWCEPRVEDLAVRMRLVYDDYSSAQKKAEELRDQVVERFSWGRAARKLIEILEE